MSFTREQWARDFLGSLGNTSPSQDTIDWVVGWTVHETGTGGGASYNLLNTTQRGPGSTTFNSVGVQNFPNYAEGVQENAAVLGQNFAGYSSLKQALDSNDIADLSAPSAGIRQGLSTWCGGCGYGVGFESLGAAHLSDSFSYGNSQPVQPGSGGSSPSNGSPAPTSCTDLCHQLYPNDAISYQICLADCNINNGFGKVQPSGCAPWDVGCVLSTSLPLLQDAALFVLGLILVIIGLVILAKPIEQNVLAGIEKRAGTVAKIAEVAA